MQILRSPRIGGAIAGATILLLAPAGTAMAATAGPAHSSNSSPTRSSGEIVYRSTQHYATGTLTTTIRKDAVPPASSSGCTGNLPTNNVQTCIYINGSGLHVDSMYGTSYVRNKAVLLVNRLHSNKLGVIKTSGAFVTVRPGEQIEARWLPNTNVPADTYCSTSYEPYEFSDGTARPARPCTAEYDGSVGLDLSPGLAHSAQCPPAQLGELIGQVGRHVPAHRRKHWSHRSFSPATFRPASKPCTPIPTSGCRSTCPESTSATPPESAP
jgi:hypothetical protein